MTPWEACTRAALLGSERQQDGIGAEGALGALLAGLAQATGTESGASASPEALLGAAAVLSRYESAGRAFGRGEAPPPCPDEELPLAGTDAHRCLEMALDGEAWRWARSAVPEILNLMAEARVLVSASFVPRLLALGAHDRSLRPAIGLVSGRLGRWLAGFNPDWRYASHPLEADPDERGFEDAPQAARRAILGRLRAADPRSGREKLEAIFSKERAQERASLLGELSTGLHQDDEPFLERCLDDRSQEVRQVAQDLLRGLAGSRLCQRMAERLAGRVYLTPRARPSAGESRFVLDLELPAAFGPDWARDGLVETTPATKGKKAWWAEQILSRIPPSHWIETLGQPAAELVRAVRGSDSESLFLRAWEASARLHRDASIAEELIRGGTAAPTLLATLSKERLDTVVTAVAERGLRSERDELLHGLDSLGGSWSPGLTLAIGRLLGQAAADGPGHSMIEAVNHAATSMDPSQHTALRPSLVEPLPPESASRARLEELCDWLGFRHRIRESLKTRVP